MAEVRSLDEMAADITTAAETAAQKPLDREFIQTAARSLSSRVATTSIRQIVCGCAAVCESPIELVIAFALGIIGLDAFDTVLFDLPSGVLGNAEGDTVLRIKPQAQIDQYRVDFLLAAVAYQNSGSGVSVSQKHLVLECDGSDFHDATAEQLVRDRRRDRDLQILAFDIFRYSGAEIWRDCFGAARQVVTFLKNSMAQHGKPAAREEIDRPRVRASAPRG